MDNIIDVASKYIGIPYKHNGNGADGMNCALLVNNILADLGVDTHAEPFQHIEEDWNKSDPSKMERALSKIGIGVTDDLRPLDIVMFSLLDDKTVISHIGVMIDTIRFIHVCDGTKSKVSKITHPFWRNKYRGARRVAVTNGQTWR